MGLKESYYLDSFLNWILFCIGLFCVTIGIGGSLLVVPVSNRVVPPPFFHYSGVWCGTIFLIISIMTAFSKRFTELLRFELTIILILVILLSFGLGFEVIEFIVWFENPIIESITSPERLGKDRIIFEQLKYFECLHKFRVIGVLISLIFGLAILLYRVINLGVTIRDCSLMRSYELNENDEKIVASMANYTFNNKFAGRINPVLSISTNQVRRVMLIWTFDMFLGK